MIEKDGQKTQTQTPNGMTLLYAPHRTFNGQALTLGRVVIGFPAGSEKEPARAAGSFQVQNFNGENIQDSFRTTDGHRFWFKDFVADPSMSKRSDGMILLHLEPGQWCWPPRV